MLASLSMLRASKSRLAALTLLLVLILGGMALPGMDAALFHARGAATGNGSRLEGPNSAGSHAIQCPLAQLLASGRAIAGDSPEPHVAPPTFAEFVTPALLPFPTSGLRSPDLARAPPSRLA